MSQIHVDHAFFSHECAECDVEAVRAAEVIREWDVIREKDVGYGLKPRGWKPDMLRHPREYDRWRCARLFLRMCYWQQSYARAFAIFGISRSDWDDAKKKHAHIEVEIIAQRRSGNLSRGF
jgi:hypothetical protein